MYGKGDPVEKAVDCSIVCIALDNYYVPCALKNWYYMWDKKFVYSL